MAKREQKELDRRITPKELRFILQRHGASMRQLSVHIDKSENYVFMKLEGRDLVPTRVVDALIDFVGEQNYIINLEDARQKIAEKEKRRNEPIKMEKPKKVESRKSKVESEKAEEEKSKS